MGIRAWGWPQLLRFWLGSLVLAVALLVAHWRGRPFRFFWIVPYPADLRTVRMLVALIFQKAPLVGVALLLVPVLVLLVTLYWAVRRFV